MKQNVSNGLKWSVHCYQNAEPFFCTNMRFSENNNLKREEKEIIGHNQAIHFWHENIKQNIYTYILTYRLFGLMKCYFIKRQIYQYIALFCLFAFIWIECEGGEGWFLTKPKMIDYYYSVFISAKPFDTSSFEAVDLLICVMYGGMYGVTCCTVKWVRLQFALLLAVMQLGTSFEGIIVLSEWCKLQTVEK